MKKPFAIIAGEPNSISSEIIFKSWNLRKKYNHKPFFIIGSIKLLLMQQKKLKNFTKIKKISDNFQLSDLYGNKLPVYDVNYSQKTPFKTISSKSNKYIFDCFNIAFKLIKSKKIIGIINCPVKKETLFKNKYHGITEYLSKKVKKKNKETMLIFNKKLSVSPITTHIPISQVSKKISQSKIIEKVKNINNFYKNILKKKPIFAVLGLNPHNFSHFKKTEEKEIINSAIRKLKKSNYNVFGPFPADTVFLMNKKKKYDAIVGMYHDQVLAPFKALHGFNSINITLGLPFFRISPDHGVAENILGKKIANPNSLIESIKFFNYIN